MLAPKFDEEAVSILGLNNSSYNGESALLTAILERAILDYVGNEEAEAQLASEWIFEGILLDDPEQVNEEIFTPTAFSFKWICHHLGLNPFKVAKFIKSMPKRGKNRVAPWYTDKNRTFSPLTSVR